MQVVVAVGIGLASVLFIKKKNDDLYSIELVSEDLSLHPNLPKDVLIYDINGPMFLVLLKSYENSFKLKW